MTIWANTIVSNEENFIWFALMSIVDFVDKIIIYDTGSTDKTVEIIKEVQKIKKNKIIFEEVGTVDKSEFPKLRQRMLEESKSDWILILDGDEIWWEDSIKKLVQKINARGNSIEGFVVPMVIPVGDIYHLQEEKAGEYQILGKKGHLSLRAISKKIPGLHVNLPYGKESYLDGENKLVQEREKIIFLETPYLHVTHLRRSSVKRKYDKYKYELGEKTPEEFSFPEVMNKDFPPLVPTPWVRIETKDYLFAKLLTPLRKIKRRI